MIKTITLNYTFGSLDSREPFLCNVEDPLLLSFKSVYAITEAVVTLENTGSGRHKSIRTSETALFPVPEEFLTAGELKIKIGLLLNGEIVKEFTVEPLILKEVDGAIQTFPAVEELREKLEAQDKTLRQLVEGYNSMIDYNKELEQRIRECEDRYDPANIL
jgi:hypothetical protein|nr:MAG TPA: hypothetical protein [Caudoviricetes sp.]